MPERKYLKTKAFSRSPKLLQEFGKVIEEKYPDRCTIGPILPSAEGDLYCMIYVYEEAQP